MSDNAKIFERFEFFLELREAERLKLNPRPVVIDGEFCCEVGEKTFKLMADGRWVEI